MAAGATFVILMGGIDLSVQSVASMASLVLAFLLPEVGFLAIPVAILAGGVAGFAGGISHTWLRIPSFISTLAIGGVVITVSFVLSDARSINISGDMRETYLFWLVGETFGIRNEIWVGLVVLALLAFVSVRSARDGWFFFSRDSLTAGYFDHHALTLEAC